MRSVFRLYFEGKVYLYGYTLVRAYLPPESLLPEAVEELHLRIHSLPHVGSEHVLPMFKSKVRNFYLEKYYKILMLGATMIAFFF